MKQDNAEWNKPSAVKERFLTKDFCLLFAANLLVGFAFYLLLTCMAEYTLTTYHTSQAIAGLSASIFVFGEMTGRFMPGFLARRFSQYMVGLMSFAVFAVFSLLYFVQTNVVFLMVIRAIQGIGFGLSTTTTQGIAFAALPKSRYAEGTSVFMLAVTCGTALGPLLGLLLTRSLPYLALFQISSAFAILAFLLYLPVKSGRAFDYADAGSIGQEYKGIWVALEKNTILFAPVVLLLGFCFYSITTFINGYGLEEGFGNFPAYMFGAYFIGLVVFRPIAGKILDKKDGEGKVMFTAFAFNIVVYICLSFVHNAVFLIPMGLMLGLGFGVLLSSGLAICSRYVPKQRKTQSVATYFIFFNVGCVLGGYLWGHVIAAIGYRSMYLCSGILAVALPLLYVLIRTRLARSAG